jgi:4-alpha-glucanotransferase
MRDNTDLGKLADAAGIEARYWDIQGGLHETSPETARHLLGAMGIAARSEVEIATSLKALAEAPWRAGFPAAIVAGEAQEIEVPVRLPADARKLRWSIEFEDGAQRGGEYALEDMEIEGRADIDGSPRVLRQLKLPPAPIGYHRLRLTVEDEFSTKLIVAPAQCYLPPSGKRYWGIAAQLYAIKSARGIGDFSDLRNLANWAAAKGADAIGVNPLHALFLDAPRNSSPYSPNSRLFLNPLYLDIAAIPGFMDLGAKPDAPLGELVDYKSITAAKLAALEQSYAQFDAGRHLFHDFVEKAGPDLHRFAIFQALSEHFATHEWGQWPPAFRDPASPEVARFAHERQPRVDFFKYLQWLCAEQLSPAAASARASGMAIGLYNDLAVSVDASSADSWCNRDLFMGDVRVGAPPDPFSEAGQEWGVVPLNPHRLKATAYAHFISLLRANMRHAGALRIDHVMGLQRLFMIPAGASPAEGTYVRFPLEDMLAIVALESRRNTCMVIGEDLGTVPAGFRERMAEANVLSCRVLYFEQEHGRFRRPQEFPQLASVCATTHDLATLRGYWAAEDISAKARLGIFKSADEEQRARDQRAADKQALLRALEAETLLPDDLQNKHEIEWTPLLANAIHAYLARSPSLLFMVQLNDLTNELSQTNLPGSTSEFPNWRRRLSRSLEEIAADPALADAMAAISRERRGI